MEEDTFDLGPAPDRMKYDFSTLDDMIGLLGLERLDCIKIDVDSFDFDVLRGGKDTLERWNPWIVVELNHALAKRNQSVNAALEWLIGRGYRRAFVTDYENYILRRESATDNSSDPSAMEVSFDRRPLFTPFRLIKGTTLVKLSLSNSSRHNAANVEFQADFGPFACMRPRPYLVLCNIMADANHCEDIWPDPCASEFASSGWCDRDRLHQWRPLLRQRDNCCSCWCHANRNGRG